jgi:hypothetical protein
MTLTEYIRDIGQAKFAQMIGVSKSQVWKYQTYVEVPRPQIARKIKMLTLGLVDYKDIYDPYFDHHEKDAGQLQFGIDPNL